LESTDQNLEDVDLDHDEGDTSRSNAIAKQVEAGLNEVFSDSASEQWDIHIHYWTNFLILSQEMLTCHGHNICQ
jgi:hypothetical protein